MSIAVTKNELNLIRGLCDGSHFENVFSRSTTLSHTLHCYLRPCAILRDVTELEVRRAPGGEITNELGGVWRPRSARNREVYRLTYRGRVAAAKSARGVCVTRIGVGNLGSGLDSD